MKRFYISILLMTVLSTLCVSAQSLKEQLQAIPSVKKVESIANGPFAEKYLLHFEQLIDPKDPSVGTFTQRVYLGNVSTDSSTVIVCEGYSGAYGGREKYRDELSRIFNFNNIVVEHRYFEESTPAGCDWKYLTAENAAHDLHCVVTALKSIYKNKWISTGISKGGQNTAIFRTFYPDDVDISVPYVGPFCRGIEDGRHEPFIADFCGSKSDRETIQDFQIDFLKRRANIMPMLKELVEKGGYKYNVSLDEVYDFCALEFPFAFWQWGIPVNTIPGRDASDKEVFEYLCRVSGPDYFVNDSPTTSFFVMAAKELGYYGYDTKPLKEYLTIKSAKGYLHKLFLPEELKGVKFDKTLSKKVDKFLKTTDAKMLFIYGEFDPWSAVRLGDEHGDNIYIYIDPAGSHRARIGTFSKGVQEEIIARLRGWLND